MIKKVLFTPLFLTCLFIQSSLAQHPKVTIKQIQQISLAKLSLCRDTSTYHLDTVEIIGKVIMDGNLTEVVSGSVSGGFRPGVHIVDTANGGEMGDFHGIQVMGTYRSGASTLPVNDIYNLTAGMIVKIIGIVDNFQGETQINPLNNTSITVLANKSAPVSKIVDLGLLNDNTRANKLPTGEEWEGSFIELENLTVTAVNVFSGGTRVSFDVTDVNGNMINVSDRFLVQKLVGYNTTRPSAPYTKGRFVAPAVGSKFQSLKGILIHSQNGCTGGTGRGYELNPFDSLHYKIGDTPPNVISENRTPQVPSATQSPKIISKITDANGNVTTVKLYYTDNINATASSFSSVNMTLVSGTTDEFEANIPTFADKSLVRYYIVATDNDNKETTYPSNNFLFYTVRNTGMIISDIQKVLNPTSDISPYRGKQVTVTGVVVSSAKVHDLGYIYIQDPNETEWAGIHVTGNSDLIKLYRNEEITITGTVEESFNFTQIAVSNVVKTGRKIKSIKPVTLNPSDSILFSSRQIEKYEGMLVQYVNPTGKVYITNKKLNNFADYTVGNYVGISNGRQATVQAGRQNSSNFSSLYVSVISDTIWKNVDGQMEVPAVVTVNGQSMDTLVGVLHYGFSLYKLLPRNNDDFKGFSVTLTKAQYPELVKVKAITNSNIKLYPNPNKGIFTLSGIQGKAQVVIYNAQGQVIESNHFNFNKQNEILSFQYLPNGVYQLIIIQENQVVSRFQYIKN